MLTKIISTAAVALALTATVAAAQEKTQAGAGLFDQGGLFYNQKHSESRQAPSNVTYGYSSVDRGTTAAIGSQTQVRTNLDRPAVAPSGIPSDTRNERGLGMFDVVN